MLHVEPIRDAHASSLPADSACSAASCPVKAQAGGMSLRLPYGIGLCST